MYHYDNTQKGKSLVLYVVFFLIIAFVFACGGLWGCSPGVEEPKDDLGESQIDLQPESPPEWTFVVNGDLMLSRGVARAMKEKGLSYPFEKVASQLQTADLTFGNLETSLSDRGTPIPGKGIWFRSDPAAAKVLKDVGYDVLSVANNHILDYDSDALLDTLKALREQGIDPVGGGKDLDDASRWVTKDIKGQKIAFIAATEMADIFWTYEYPRTFEATADLPGVLKFDAEQLAQMIAPMKEEVEGKGMVVTSLHWGVEYSDYPEAYQRDAAHKLVDAGSKLVIGHHPHCLQGVEVYNGSFIAYSLGNFVFDKQRRAKCQETLLVEMSFSGDELQKVELYPIMIIDEQPRPAVGDDAMRILKKMKQLSSELGTEIEIEGEKGVITVTR